MPLFLWTQQFSVNNEDLDLHHKILINILNRLYDNCLLDGSMDYIQPILDELMSYAIYHFTAEEQYMTSTEYKDIFNHKQMHLYFIDKVRQLRKENHNNEVKVSIDLIEFLGNWLRLHILREDQKYKI